MKIQSKDFSGLSPIKNFHSKFQLFQLLTRLTDAESFFIKRSKKLGDPFTENFPGIGDLTITGDPEGAQEIFGSPREKFAPFQSRLLEPVLGDHSLLVIAGDQHRREKSLMAPPFHGERMKVYGRLIQKAALEEFENWKKKGRFLARPEIQKITLKIIIRAVFGIQDPDQYDLWRRRITTYLGDYKPSLAFPALRKSIFLPWRQFLRSRALFDRLILDEITRRAKENPEKKDDILSLLLLAKDQDNSGMTPEEIRDELKTLLIVGHETAATGLAWALYLVLSHPPVYQNLIKELSRLGTSHGTFPAPADLANAPYLGAICNEVLRLHPIVPIVIRRLSQDFNLRGQKIEAGKHIAVSLVLLHRNPKTWKNPELFIPERFLEQGQAKKYSIYEYAPFGGGNRRCIGAAFALYEMKIILGTLFTQAGFELLPQKSPKPVIRQITMGPGSDIPIRILISH